MSPRLVAWVSGRSTLSDLTGPTLYPVPNQPKTPQHSFRCPDDLWEKAGGILEERGTSRAEYLRDCLEALVMGRESVDDSENSRE